MNENSTIFQSPPGENAQPPAAPAPPGPPAPVSPATEEMIPEHTHSSLFSTILKVVLGLFFIVGAGFAVVSFVPALFSNKNQKVTLVYWGLFEDEHTMQVIISDFEKQHPNITVSYVLHKVEGYKDKLLFRTQNGTGPDIFRFHNTWVPQLRTVLLPFPKDTLPPEEFNKQFYKVMQKDLVKNGALYGIPLEVDTLALFTNTDMFSAAGISSVPTKWDEFQNAAINLTVKDENGKIKTAGAALGTMNNVAHAHDIISLLFAQRGADFNNLSKTSEQAADALTFYTSFTKTDDNQKVWDDTLDPSQLAFATGKLAMYFGFSWDIFAIKAISPNLSFRVSPVPHLPGTNLTIASYWAEGVSQKSKHQNEALLFMKYFAQKETEQKLFTQAKKTRLFGEPYANRDLAQTVKDDLYLYPFVSQASSATSSFFADFTYDNGLNTKANTYLTNAVNSMLVNNTSAQSAVATLANGVESVLNSCCK